MKNRTATYTRTSLGITLVEVMVGVAILGILLAVATPSLSDLLERRRIAAAAQEVADVLHYARSQPAIIGDSVRLRFDKDDTVKESKETSCIAVITVSGFDNCRCYRNPVCIPPPKALPTDPMLQGAEVLRVFQLKNSDGVSFEGKSKTRVNNRKNELSIYGHMSASTNIGVQFIVKGARTKAELHVKFSRLGRVRICTPDSSMSGYPACVANESEDEL